MFDAGTLRGSTDHRVRQKNLATDAMMTGRR
jgi:hypothetical protein